ncbi:MAG TPA: acetolactate synthase large subunit [Verrucomicrobiae bacterium]|nr:acetolactate synthase large subunit [Verrucomicrobiae bacterium]
MNKMTGAQLIVRLLERQGIRIVSGIPGGANLPLYDALSQSRQIRHVLARHEQGAGFIAQGMARVTGTPQVCLATSGPGATNVLTAVADAKLDSIPLICITGQVPRAMIGTDAFQEVNTFGMSLPVTKHNFLVRSAAELLEVIPAAFRIAASGRPGPVLIDVPKDVQNERVEFESWPEPGKPDAPPRFDAGDIARAAEMINASCRPILYLGGGVIHSDRGEERVSNPFGRSRKPQAGTPVPPFLKNGRDACSTGAAALARQLAEKASLPTTMTLMALGAMPSDHPLSLGMLGMHAARFTNMALEECDLLIAAGARFDDRATGRVAQFCPQAKIIHIDIDASELDKIKTAHIGIVGDVGEVLDALLPLVEENPRREWREHVAEFRQMFPLQTPGADDPQTHYGLITAVANLLDDDAIVTTDVGQHQMWTAQAYPFRRPRQWLTSGGLGTMGFGVPAAIGAALACPDRTVVCFSGDGSLLMNCQELATAAEENVNIKVVLMNNNSLGLVHQQQDLFYGRRVFASDYRARVDFIGLAASLGVKAYDLADAADPSAMLGRALREKGPCLIHALIDANEKVYPMVPPGAANREMLGHENHVHAVA